MPKKAEQQVKNWLRNVFTRNHNSRSDGGKRIDKNKEKAMTDWGYETDVNASDFGDNQGGTKKTIMWCLIAIMILIGALAYIQYNKKKAANAIAKVEALDLDTISASRVSQVQEMRKQSSVHPVQQEVTTVPEPEPEQKQQAEPEQEPTKTEPEYAPNGEVLIQKPVYPKDGFDSYQEQEEYFNTLQEYWKQQRRISDWKIQHDIE